MKPYLRVRWPLWGVLVVVVAAGGVSTWRRLTRETVVLATTTCPFRGEPRVVISPGVTSTDSAPVRVHEGVHAAQCDSLGPVRYRLRNLFPGGKLALEAPAYCAAAAVRLRAGLDSALVRDRLRSDISEALRDVADSAAVDAALRAHCPAIIGHQSGGQRSASARRSRQP